MRDTPSASGLSPQGGVAGAATIAVPAGDNRAPISRVVPPGGGRTEPDGGASGSRVESDWEALGEGIASTGSASATFVAEALVIVSGPRSARPAAKLPSAIATPTVLAATNTVILRTTNATRLMPRPDLAARSLQDRSKSLTESYHPAVMARCNPPRSPTSPSHECQSSRLQEDAEFARGPNVLFSAIDRDHGQQGDIRWVNPDVGRSRRLLLRKEFA